MAPKVSKDAGRPLAFARYCVCGVSLEARGVPCYPNEELDRVFKAHMKQGCRSVSKSEWQSARLERKKNPVKVDPGSKGLIPGTRKQLLDDDGTAILKEEA